MLPSGVARATCSLAIPPCAPARLSTTTGRPRSGPSSVGDRAGDRVVGAAAGVGTISLIGRVRSVRRRAARRAVGRGDALRTPREHVAGQVKVALEDLPGGADEAGPAHDHHLAVPLGELNLDLDPALRVQDRDLVRPRRHVLEVATVPGSANAVATPMAPVTAWKCAPGGA